MAELEITKPEPELVRTEVPLDSDDEMGAATPAPFDSGVENLDDRKVSVIEQCLAWGGEQRLRLVLTLSVGGELQHAQTTIIAAFRIQHGNIRHI